MEWLLVVLLFYSETPVDTGKLRFETRAECFNAGYMIVDALSNPGIIKRPSSADSAEPAVVRYSVECIPVPKDTQGMQ